MRIKIEVYYLVGIVETKSHFASTIVDEFS
jgi:hypothetical protein